MGFIPPETIDLVRARADLIEVIGERVTLTQKGRQFWACCPFHHEKTPSFSVHPDRQIYKCFGCQKGGNVFGFIQEYERVTFPEAVKIVGERFGIEVLETQGNNKPEKSVPRRELLDVAEWACVFFERQLQADNELAKICRAYLEKRQITGASISRFRLGLAPPGWDGLLKAARKTQISQKQLIKLGLVIHRDSGMKTKTYDRFRGRLMFPIFDPQGRVIAFGGRRLDENKETPKYINSSEVPGFFEKRRVLYGLNFAKEERAETLHIVEGYTDVIMASQAGVTGMVAVLGTAFGPNHLPLVKRFARRVVVLFDGDQAGQAAAARSLEPLVAVEMDIRVASLKTAKDPCDLVIQEGAAALESVIDSAKGVFDFILDQASQSTDDSLASKSQAIDKTLKLLASMPPLRLHLHLGVFAERFSVPEQQLRKRLAEIRSNHQPKKHRSPAKFQTKQTRNDKTSAKNPAFRQSNWQRTQNISFPKPQNGHRHGSSKNPTSSSKNIPRRQPIQGAKAQKFGNGAELKILEALIAVPQATVNVFSLLTPHCFSPGPARNLATRLQVASDLGSIPNEAELYDQLEETDLELLHYLSERIALGREKAKNYQGELTADSCQRLLATSHKQQRTEIRKLLKIAEQTGNLERVAELESELQESIKPKSQTREVG